MEVNPSCQTHMSDDWKTQLELLLYRQGVRAGKKKVEELLCIGVNRCFLMERGRMACGNVTGGGMDVACWLLHTALLCLTPVLKLNSFNLTMSVVTSNENEMTAVPNITWKWPVMAEKISCNQTLLDSWVFTNSYLLGRIIPVPSFILKWYNPLTVSIIVVYTSVLQCVNWEIMDTVACGSP